MLTPSSKLHADNPFDEMPQRPILYFNSIIRASLIKGSPLKTLLNFRTLVGSHPFRPDARTFSLVLRASQLSSAPEPALQTHARFIKTGYKLDPAPLFHFYLQFNLLPETRQLFDESLRFKPDPVPGNLLIAALLRSREVEKARGVFAKMPVKDLVSWNSMLAGLVQNARPKEGLVLFDQMVGSGVEPDMFTFSAVLSCCARTGALNHGERVHRLMVENRTGFKFESNPFVVSALIDMYSKCGRIEAARAIFCSVEASGISVYNAMMTGFAIHGLGSEGIRLFRSMEESGVSPDGITFVGLLTALSHSGLVEPARQYFDSMCQVYSIEPQVEHYAAMVDALARAGQLDEAWRTIDAMPIEPDAVVWRSFLSGCRRHRRLDLAEPVIGRMEKLRSGEYVTMSNIYSSAKQFEWAEQAWNSMREQGVRKKEGVSWIELGGKLHRFKAGSKQAHPEIESIHRLLSELTKRAKDKGFAPMTGIVTMDVDEEEKEENLRWHSEKIAVAYAVLKTAPGTEIRISKNLTTCTDCHEWMKVVSKVLCRVIVMRDRIRFHRFERGSCSCGDYW